MHSFNASLPPAVLSSHPVRLVCQVQLPLFNLGRGQRHIACDANSRTNSVIVQ